MALQTKSFTANGARGHHKFTLTLTENSISTEHNHSSVSFSFVLSPIAKNYDWVYSSTVPVTYTISINGTKYNGNIMTYDGINTITVKSDTMTIPHNIDGTKTISVSFSVSDIGSSYLPGAASASGTMVLTTVPKAAIIVSAPNFTDEDSPTINYINPAGEAVSSLEVCITSEKTNAAIPYRAISKTGSTYTFNFTQAEKEILWNDFLKGKTMANAVFQIKTVLNGQTFIELYDTTVKLVNHEPVVSVEIKETDQLILSLTGSPSKTIKSNNSIIVNIDGTAKKGASIVNYKCVNGNNVGWMNSNAFSNIETPNFEITVFDDRGVITTVPASIEMADYFTPTCSVKTQTDIEGETTAKVTVIVSGSCFTGNFGASTNPIEVSYRSKLNDGSYGYWQTIDNVSVSNDKYRATFTFEMNYLDTCVIQARISDLLSVASSVEHKVRIVPVFDWSGEDFNFNVPIYINGVEMDYIVEQGTKNGWFYRKWNSGAAECWYSASVSGIDVGEFNMNGFYYSGSKGVNFPFTFTSVAYTNASGGSTGNMNIVRPFNHTTTGMTYVVMGNADVSSATVRVNLEAKGMWR